MTSSGSPPSGCARGGGAPSPHADALPYGYLAYHTYFSILNRLKLQRHDVVADVGAGKGRVVCAAATYRVRKVIGVEVDPSLCAQAAANLETMRDRRAAAAVVCQSAADFRFDAVTVVMMFHPFGAATMREVLRRIEESLVRSPRNLRLAYGNPLLSPMLTAEPWLELTECWMPRRWSRIKFPVHFYASR